MMTGYCDSEVYSELVDQHDSKNEFFSFYALLVFYTRNNDSHIFVLFKYFELPLENLGYITTLVSCLTIADTILKKFLTEIPSAIDTIMKQYLCEILDKSEILIIVFVFSCEEFF